MLSSSTYSHLGETVAGGGVGGPVLVGAGLVALDDQLLYLGHFVIGLIALEEGVRVLLQYAENRSPKAAVFY